MSARGVRIVVGEGPSERKGLLRFVVDGEGYDVVAEASTTAELRASWRPTVPMSWSSTTASVPRPSA